MIKYRIFSKETVVDNMDEDQVTTCIDILRTANPNIIYDFEKYNWSSVEKRMGRDTDLH